MAAEETSEPVPTTAAAEGVTGTDLGQAAREGDLDTMQQLVDQHGVAIDSPTVAGGTALVQAAAGRQVAAAEWLLSKGADPNATTEGGRTCLHLAAEGGDVAFIAAVLSYLLPDGTSAADVNWQDTYGYTPLHVAAQAGQGESCKALITAGADPNIKAKLDPNLGEETPIMIAVRKLQPANKDKALRKAIPGVVQALLEGGADIEAKGPMGDTVYDQARSLTDVPEGRQVYEMIEEILFNSSDGGSYSDSSDSSAESHSD